MHISMYIVSSLFQQSCLLNLSCHAYRADPSVSHCGSPSKSRQHANRHHPRHRTLHSVPALARPHLKIKHLPPTRARRSPSRLRPQFHRLLLRTPSLPKLLRPSINATPCRQTNSVCIYHILPYILTISLQNHPDHLQPMGSALHPPQIQKSHRHQYPLQLLCSTCRHPA